MKLFKIETCFKELANLDIDLSVFPCTSEVRQTRRLEHKDLGEVFTPIHLVDKMILTSTPKPDKFTMDLCAGQGQFTIRILRYHLNNDPTFDVEHYLKNYHWFNELNPVNIEALYYIFGKDINLAVGDARCLSNYPEKNNIWLQGTYFHNPKSNTWTKTKKKDKSIELF